MTSNLLAITSEPRSSLTSRHPFAMEDSGIRITVYDTLFFASPFSGSRISSRPRTLKIRHVPCFTESVFDKFRGIASHIGQNGIAPECAHIPPPWHGTPGYRIGGVIVISRIAGCQGKFRRSPEKFIGENRITVFTRITRLWLHVSHRRRINGPRVRFFRRFNAAIGKRCIILAV